MARRIDMAFEYEHEIEGLTLTVKGTFDHEGYFESTSIELDGKDLSPIMADHQVDFLDQHAVQVLFDRTEEAKLEKQLDAIRNSYPDE